MKQIRTIGATFLLSAAGSAIGQCDSPCTEPSDCPPSFTQSIGFVSGACCVTDTSTTMLCSKYTVTLTAIDCRFTGVVSAVASTASNASYSTNPGICTGSNDDFQLASCADTGPAADLDMNETSSAAACSSAIADAVSSSHNANMFVSPSLIRGVSSANITNIARSSYNNCLCQSGGSGSGIGGGYADATTLGGIGLDCEPGGQVLMDHDSSTSSRITHRNAARNAECDGPPERPGPPTPIAADLACKTLIERNAKGDVIARHTDMFFNVEFDDGTSLMQNTLGVYENQGRSGSKLINLDPRTASIDLDISLQSAGRPVTWQTWLAFNDSVGSIWADDSYRLEADLNLDGLIDFSDADLILKHNSALDLDADGRIGSRDIMSFLSLLVSGNPAADINMDGRLDIMDFIDWKDAIQNGK